jgi:hypothetical protein
MMDKYHKEAVNRYIPGEQLSVTINIADQTVYGYGYLDAYGFWEYPLYFKI